MELKFDFSRRVCAELGVFFLSPFSPGNCNQNAKVNWSGCRIGGDEALPLERNATNTCSLLRVVKNTNFVK